MSLKGFKFSFRITLTSQYINFRLLYTIVSLFPFFLTTFTTSDTYTYTTTTATNNVFYSSSAATT